MFGTLAAILLLFAFFTCGAEGRGDRAGRFEEPDCLPYYEGRMECG